MSLDDLRPWDRRIAVASALLLAAYPVVAKTAELIYLALHRGG